ncbi:homeobox protein cut-like 1 isoform X2 [Oryctolagus cuniculus]|uniref:homeobox protein cut-like 1 isoform X2 n=1 Tax=Oryctolagus cuniculus TaxID=9986 RepID=UPI003879EFBE
MHRDLRTTPRARVTTHVRRLRVANLGARVRRHARVPACPLAPTSKSQRCAVRTDAGDGREVSRQPPLHRAGRPAGRAPSSAEPPARTVSALAGAAVEAAAASLRLTDYDDYFGNRRQRRERPTGRGEPQKGRQGPSPAHTPLRLESAPAATPGQGQGQGQGQGAHRPRPPAQRRTRDGRGRAGQAGQAGQAGHGATAPAGARAAEGLPRASPPALTPQGCVLGRLRRVPQGSGRRGQRFW